MNKQVPINKLKSFNTQLKETNKYLKLVCKNASFTHLDIIQYYFIVSNDEIDVAAEVEKFLTKNGFIVARIDNEMSVSFLENITVTINLTVEFQQIRTDDVK